jgi:carboxymethylenebutenolidase
MRIELPSGTPAEFVAADSPERSLVVVPDIWGLRPLFDTICADLSARTGWSVVAVEPFPGLDLPGSTDPDGLGQRGEALRARSDADLLGDLVAAADVAGCASAGVVGFCMGGMYALKAAAVGRFDRAVSFYGMIRVPEAWAGPRQGQPLEAVAARGDCQVLALVGTVDGWTPPEDVDALEAAGAQVVRYEGADHGFVHDPQRPAHRADYAADAWQRSLEFLRQ